MTYRKLKELINSFTEDELDQNIIIIDVDECFEVVQWTLSGLYGLDFPLKDGKVVLGIKGEESETI